MSRKLFAGPWVGEFGWELFGWQGYIRSLSKQYDETVIVSKPSSEPLYRDFANKFIGLKSVGAPDCSSVRTLNNSNTTQELIDLNNKLFQDILQEYEGYDVLTPTTSNNTQNIHTHAQNTRFDQPVPINGYGLITPEYITYGTESKSIQYDIVVHARNRKHRYPDNWPEERWNELCDRLSSKYTIACIGLSHSSFAPQSTVRYINCSLDTTFDILRNSKLIIGPSSGPMHLATLCKTPQLVWGFDYPMVRYKTNFNPFNTRVMCYSDEEWDPSVDTIYNETCEFLNILDEEEFSRS